MALATRGGTVVGDMTIAGEPSATLMSALTTIARHLHEEIDREPGYIVGRSKGACTFASHVVLDYLKGLGFSDARVAPVVLVLASGSDQHRLTLNRYIGTTNNAKHRDPDRWNGHMVVVVDGYLVDTTLYRDPPIWAGPCGMVAAPIITMQTAKVVDLTPLAMLDAKRNGSIYRMLWLDNPNNIHWTEHDALRSDRSQIVRRLLRQ